MRVAFVPIDDRPVCYTLPKLIAEIDEGIEFFMPDRGILGNLKKKANSDAIIEWLENLPNIDSIILSLDTIVYGGLIPSRRGKETLEELGKRLEKLKIILKEKSCKIYAHSSIMRISNNNCNEEEKEYWSLYGKKIFKYSYNLHKTGNSDIATDIPDDILQDYLMTRKRNFEINKNFLSWQKEGLFDTLVFSKDDCSQFGLNVKEANELALLGGYTKTGADEIPLSLLSRAIKGDFKVCPIFLEPEQKDLISNYEDVSIEKSVLGQLELAGCEIAKKETADILLYINNFKTRQGEIVMKIDTEGFEDEFKPIGMPYMIADVRFANGSDNKFIDNLFLNCSQFDDENFYGYSGWNTSANSLGSLICGAKIKFLASKYNSKSFKNLQITRFLDDWGYQANVRQSLTTTDKDLLCKLMKSYELKLSKFLDTNINVNYSFPWERLFEVEIEFN